MISCFISKLNGGHSAESPLAGNSSLSLLMVCHINNNIVGTESGQLCAIVLYIQKCAGVLIHGLALRGIGTLKPSRSGRFLAARIIKLLK